MTTAKTPRRPGRPRGSITLTDEMADQVLTLIRAGGSLRSAAIATGIPERTLQGWVARGLGRTKEPATRKLKDFARRVEQAQAEARVSAEVRLHKTQPGRWLRDRVATPDAGGDDDDGPPDPQQIRDLAKRFRDALLFVDPSEVVPPCPNRRCRCVYHAERSPEDLAAIKAMLAKAVAS